MIGGAGGGGERQFPIGDHDDVVPTDASDWLLYLVILAVLVGFFVAVAVVL